MHFPVEFRLLFRLIPILQLLLVIVKANQSIILSKIAEVSPRLKLLSDSNVTETSNHDNGSGSVGVDSVGNILQFSNDTLVTEEDEFSTFSTPGPTGVSRADSDGSSVFVNNTSSTNSSFSDSGASGDGLNGIFGRSNNSYHNNSNNNNNNMSLELTGEEEDLGNLTSSRFEMELNLTESKLCYKMSFSKIC